MKKQKDFDTFSFNNDISHHDFEDRKQLMANYQYRIDTLQKQTNKIQHIPEKVFNLDKIIQQNAKRRQQIERQLQIKRQDLVQQNHLKDLIQKNVTFIQAKQFSNIQQQKNRKDSKLKKTKQYTSTKLQLNVIELALLQKQLSFPQEPSISKEKLIKIKNKLQTLKIVHQHSDVIYLLMVSNYHLNLFQEVINDINNLLMFKRFNPKGFWIAAEAAYNIENYQKCNKLSELAINQIKNNAKVLPRLLYLKGKSNMQLCNNLQAIITYNQLITLQSNVPEFYLQRSLLFERSNYNDYAEEDFKKYRNLKPNWKNNLRQKILLQKSKDRKQYYQALLKSLQEY